MMMVMEGYLGEGGLLIYHGHGWDAGCGVAVRILLVVPSVLV